MTTQRSSKLILGVEFALLLVLLTAWLLSWDATKRPDEETGTGRVLGSSLQAVTIHGDARTPITLGALVSLDLSLDNPNNFALTIEKVTVTVLEVEAPRADADHPCSAGDFEVRQLEGGVVLTLAADSDGDLSGMEVPPGSWPAVGMLNRPVNQDGCKGAFLTLGYKASGVEVHR